MVRNLSKITEWKTKSAGQHYFAVHLLTELPVGRLTTNCDTIEVGSGSVLPSVVVSAQPHELASARTLLALVFTEYPTSLHIKNFDQVMAG